MVIYKPATARLLRIRKYPNPRNLRRIGYTLLYLLLSPWLSSSPCFDTEVPFGRLSASCYGKSLHEAAASLSAGEPRRRGHESAPHSLYIGKEVRAFFMSCPLWLFMPGTHRCHRTRCALLHVYFPPSLRSHLAQWLFTAQWGQRVRG